MFAVVVGTAGINSRRVEEMLRALDVRIIDLPLHAAHHYPQLSLIDVARRAEQEANGENAVVLSLADLCILGYAMANDYPGFAGNRHWVSLATHGLAGRVHLYQR